MDRSFSSRRCLISILAAAGAAATLPACANPELPPGISDEVVIAQKAPPPISGGTLLVTSKGIAVAADADRDTVWMVDLNNPSVKSVVLAENDEPGRVIEDGAGRVHVALRQGGKIVTIDPATAKIVDQSPVCPAPRGMAYDAKSDVIHVACAGGELVTLPAAGGAPVRSLMFKDRDLRDVAISGDNLLITRFRQAELLTVNSQGNIINRSQPPSIDSFNKSSSGSFSPTGAFRMVPLAGGGVAVTHQRSLTTPVIITQPGGYGGDREDPSGCSGGIVHPTVTTFNASGNPTVGSGSPMLPQATLPVDLAVSADGNSIAVVAAGSDKVIKSSLTDVANGSNNTSDNCLSNAEILTVGAPVAAAFWGNTLIVQSREPAAIHIFTASGDMPQILTDKSVNDTGHRLFHHEASETSHIACASCHLDGHEDAHTWTFDSIGARRTQSLGGDFSDTAPFHWDGDMKDLGMIMDEVFQNRMGGVHQGPRHVNAIQSWVGNIPRLAVSPPDATEIQIKHGEQLFQQANCSSCHAGALYTNNTNQDVGTGKAFQVPSLLGLSNRAPYLHDGSAATLHDRFTAPGASTLHGNTVNMSASDIDDLVAYLETL